MGQGVHRGTAVAILELLHEGLARHHQVLRIVGIVLL